MLFTWLVAALILPQALAGSFVLSDPGYLMMSRLDPVVSPGKPGTHVHQVVGASNFRNVLNTPAEQQRAACTTMPVGDDKSVYWTPVVYWINATTTPETYQPLQSRNRIYYSWPNSRVVEFPRGLRMVSGTARQRDMSDIRALGVRIKNDPGYGADGQKGGPREEAQYLYNGTRQPHPPHGDHFVLGLHYPSCGWANQTLDSADHFAHLAWPVADDGSPRPAGDKCPASHPVRYPRIYWEALFYLTPKMKAQWNTTGVNFILGNGDTTGLTWHADFINGWAPGVLRRAMEECHWDVEEDLRACPPLAASLQGDKRRDCRLQAQVLAEEVGLLRPLSKMPGCNPKWDWDGPATHVVCTNMTEPGFTSPNLQWAAGEMRLPLVQPGLYAGPPWNLSTGEYNVTEWARSFDNATSSANVSVGTQAEVDANKVQNTTNANSTAVNMSDPSTFSDVGGTATVDLKGFATVASQARERFCADDADLDKVPCTVPPQAAGMASGAVGRLVPLGVLGVALAFVLF